MQAGTSRSFRPLVRLARQRKDRATRPDHPRTDESDANLWIN